MIGQALVKAPVEMGQATIKVVVLDQQTWKTSSPAAEEVSGRSSTLTRD